MIDQLDKFHRIAWDFDGTLIDHPKAPVMHKFIKEHSDKTHIIVTFRTHGWQKQVFTEMLTRYPEAPDKSYFDGVINISNRAWEGFTEMQRKRAAGRIHGPLSPWELYYVNWKGLVCKLKNLQVLIDDKSEHVLPGCEKYGIVFVHPDDL